MEGIKAWPKGVSQITLEKLDLLGIDEQNRLYWNGDQVELSYRLTRWQAVGAVSVTISAIVGALATAVQAWAAWVSCGAC